MDVKVIFVGNCGVGKSSIISYLCTNTFIPCESTIAMDSMRLNIIGDKNEHALLTLWDTAGQEKYRSISRAYFKNAKFIIFVYSATDAQSFLDLQKWISEAAPYSSLKEVVIAIVANKID
jgi:small GTP-binding protein